MGKVLNKTQILQPKNRFDMFFYLHKTNILGMSILSGLTAIFSLPLILYYFISSIVRNNMLGELTKVDAVGKVELLKSLYQNDLFANLVYIPLIVILFVGFAGLFYCARNFVWNECPSVFKDFFKGIKTNWKQFLILGVFFGVLLYLYNALQWYFVFNSKSIFDKILELVVSVFCLGYFGGIAMFSVTQSSIYNISTFQLIKNSAIFSIIKFVKNVGILLLALFPLLLVGKFQTWRVQFLVISIMCVYGFSYCAIIITLYSHSVFDKYINQDKYVELVNKGLKD